MWHADDGAAPPGLMWMADDLSPGSQANPVNKMSYLRYERDVLCDLRLLSQKCLSGIIKSVVMQFAY